MNSAKNKFENGCDYESAEIKKKLYDKNYGNLIQQERIP
jgi:hypothetical protein